MHQLMKVVILFFIPFLQNCAESNSTSTEEQKKTDLGVVSLNNKPKLSVQPITQASVGSLYSFILKAEDKDNDSVRISIKQKPIGMVWNEESNQITWTPTKVDDFEVIIVLDDGHDVVRISYVIVVRRENEYPIISSYPPLKGVVDSTYLYQLKIDDPDKDSVYVKLVSPPEGMIIDQESLKIMWVPTKEGFFEIELEVQDSFGNISSDFFDIQVEISYSFNLRKDIKNVLAQRKSWKYEYTKNYISSVYDKNSLRYTQYDTDLYSLTKADTATNEFSLAYELTRSSILVSEGDTTSDSTSVQGYQENYSIPEMPYFVDVDSGIVQKVVYAKDTLLMVSTEISTNNSSTKMLYLEGYGAVSYELEEGGYRYQTKTSIKSNRYLTEIDGVPFDIDSVEVVQDSIGTMSF